jgi:hypothetical protein
MAMSFVEHWFALSARIKGLQDAGELYARFMGYHQEDSYGAGKNLGEQCGSVVVALEEFRGAFAQTLPAAAMQSLDRFFSTNLAKAAKDSSADHRAARGALVALTALEAEVTFILAGRQERIRVRSERAFLHLQRQLVVDEEIRAKWQKAFSKGEVSCEKLGSVHLLSHGIYAFKVDAAGARTDLIFNDAPNEETIARVVEGLVLTEWKVATDSDFLAKIAAARAQADLYKAGPLAGVELTGYRYLVVVSNESSVCTSA